MKKAICILLCVVLAFCVFTGCEEAEESNQDISNTSIIVNSSKESAEDVDVNSTGFSSESSEKTFKIIHLTQEYSGVVLDIVGTFFEDDNYIYYFGSYLDLEAYCVEYSDGTMQNVKEALEAGSITIADLDRFGIEYMKEPKDTSN